MTFRRSSDGDQTSRSCARDAGSTPAERAIADVLTFRRFWGDAWAFERIEMAALEMAYERQQAPHREHRQRQTPSR